MIEVGSRIVLVENKRKLPQVWQDIFRFLVLPGMGSRVGVGSSVFFWGLRVESWEFDSLTIGDWELEVGSRTKNLSTQRCGVGILGVWQFLGLGSWESNSLAIFWTVSRTKNLSTSHPWFLPANFFK